MLHVLTHEGDACRTEGLVDPAAENTVLGQGHWIRPATHERFLNGGGVLLDLAEWRCRDVQSNYPPSRFRTQRRVGQPERVLTECRFIVRAKQVVQCREIDEPTPAQPFGELGVG